MEYYTYTFKLIYAYTLAQKRIGQVYLSLSNRLEEEVARYFSLLWASVSSFARSLRAASTCRLNSLHTIRADYNLSVYSIPFNQGWGAGKFFSGSGSSSWLFSSGSGSWFFSQAAPAPGIFFWAAPAPAPRGQKHPAPAPQPCFYNF